MKNLFSYVLLIITFIFTSPVFAYSLPVVTANPLSVPVTYILSTFKESTPQLVCNDLATYIIGSKAIGAVSGTVGQYACSSPPFFSNNTINTSYPSGYTPIGNLAYAPCPSGTVQGLTPATCTPKCPSGYAGEVTVSQANVNGTFAVVGNGNPSPTLMAGSLGNGIIVPFTSSNCSSLRSWHLSCSY